MPENDEVMQMEVEAEQDEFLGDNVHEELDYEQEEASSDEEDEEMEFSTNNNACMSEDEENAEINEESANQLDRRLSAQEKEEIMTEAYDKAMNKMKECMQEVMSNSGFMVTAQLIQEQLKKGAYMDVGNSQGRSTTINNKNQAQTKSKGKINTSNGKGIPHTSRVPVQVDSEITIYRNAVCNGINKQSSSSSKEGGWLNNTSDQQDDSEETTEVLDKKTEKINCDKEIDNIISESRQ